MSSNIFIYRMTHIENIPHIFEHGITHRQSPNANPHYKPIGDSSIISKRDMLPAIHGKKLGDYIPFYFSNRTPMLFTIQRGYNGVPQTLATNIVYCVCSVADIVYAGLNFIFTDGHAVDGITKFYTKSAIQHINSIVDFLAVNEKFWNDKDVDLKRRKQAEFLVEDDIPNHLIEKYIVYDVQAAQKLIKFGIPPQKIDINSSYYF